MAIRGVSARYNLERPKDLKDAEGIQKYLQKVSDMFNGLQNSLDTDILRVIEELGVGAVDVTHDHSGGDGAQINHTTLSNIGTNTHAQIDTKLVTNGDSHDHSGGDGAQVNHTTLSNIGTNTHSQIDTHLGSAAPHSGHAPTANGVTNGNSHDHSGGDGAQIDHGGLGGLSDDDHTQYQKESEKGAVNGYAGLNADSAIELLTSNKSQLMLYGGAGQGGSITGLNTGVIVQCSNVTYNGSSWNRIDVNKGASIIYLAPGSAPTIYAVSAGANPISSWDLINGLILETTTGSQAKVDTHRDVAAPHSGHFSSVRVGNFTRDTTVASGTQVISGFTFTPVVVIFILNQSNSLEVSIGFDWFGLVRHCTYYYVAGATWVVDNSYSLDSVESAANYYTGYLSAVTSTSMTVSWAKGGSPTGTVTVQYMALGRG